MHAYPYLARLAWQVFKELTKKEPRYKSEGGTHAEDVALQNIQARSRMVLSYLLAQLLPWTRGRSGFLLVLGSANVDEALRGYMTKYDCSAADVNPIGGISKADLKRFLVHAAAHLGYPSLRAVVEAPPTAELRPLKGGEIEQTDEEDMGMTYDELGVFGRLRKVLAAPAPRAAPTPRAPMLCALRLPRSLAPLSAPHQIEHCGPVSMFQKLLSRWQGSSSAAEVAAKVHALPPDETRPPNH